MLLKILRELGGFNFGAWEYAAALLILFLVLSREKVDAQTKL